MGPDEMSNNVGNPILAAYRVPAHLARRFHQICLGAVAEVIGPTGVTPSEYAVLVSIVDLPGLHQHRLATCLGIDPMSASQTIDRLEHMGLINRRVDPSDSRACVLTRRGARLWRRLKPLLSTAQERIMAPLKGVERQTSWTSSRVSASTAACRW